MMLIFNKVKQCNILYFSKADLGGYRKRDKREERNELI